MVKLLSMFSRSHSRWHSHCQCIVRAHSLTSSASESLNYMYSLCSLILCCGQLWITFIASESSNFSRFLKQAPKTFLVDTHHNVWRLVSDFFSPLKHTSEPFLSAREWESCRADMLTYSAITTKSKIFAPLFLYDPVGWLLQFFTDRKIMY